MSRLCLRCVGLNVADTVETYYRMLVFVPWSEFRAQNVERFAKDRDSNRQTGRSTHAALETIAHAIQRGFNIITVASPDGVQYMMDMVNRLHRAGCGGVVSLAAIPRAHAGGITYATHHEDHFWG